MKIKINDFFFYQKKKIVVIYFNYISLIINNKIYNINILIILNDKYFSVR